jgi:uncharacterized protein (TIGR04255 family)
VVEVAMSVQFEPPSTFNLAHLGAFWATQKDTFPKVRTTSPIISAAEDFGAERQWLPPSLKLAFSDEPQYRLQMTSDDDQWMCQIQSDRLVVNWRKRVADYPRFDATFVRFKAAWQALHRFFAEEKISAPSATLWELTYVNRIPKGELWQSPSDWPAVFPGLWGGVFVATDELTLRGLRGQWVWDSAPEQARLYVEPSPSRSNENPPTELLMVNMTARGSIKLDDSGAEKIPHEQAIENGMNLGHDLIVLTFDKISSNRAKEHWKRHA